MTDHDKTAQERERFEAWWLTSNARRTGATEDHASEVWQARAALDTIAEQYRSDQESSFFQMRERIAAVREDQRRKMNAAGDRAEMAASTGDMKEAAINSTESERHREAFVALNVAIGIIDSTEFPSVAQQPPASASAEPLSFVYRNWRGEVSERRAVPQYVYFGATEWHPEPQWMMRALDVDKGAVRDFAMRDMAFASAGAGKAEPVTCVACEGHPQALNDPCTVCGAPSTEKADPVAWVNKSHLDSIIERSGRVYWHAPMMCGSWFKGAFPLYAAPPAQPVAVSVKPLEWGVERLCGDGRQAQDARSPIGGYVATETGWFLTGQTGYEREEGLGAAKAAAQADYERRVMSCITTAPAHPDAASYIAREVRHYVECSDNGLAKVPRELLCRINLALTIGQAPSEEGGVR